MNTYLVRTKSDHTLMGVFCADSVADLAIIIDSVFDARECEYLKLQANEGLFVEARFTIENGHVALVHPDEISAPSSSPATLPETFETQDNSADPSLDERDILEEDDEYIPPVLEPTMALAARIQRAHDKNEWRPVVEMPPVQNPRPYILPRLRSKHSVQAQTIDADSIARKLMKGTLTPAMFIHNASRRHH